MRNLIGSSTRWDIKKNESAGQVIVWEENGEHYHSFFPYRGDFDLESLSRPANAISLDVLRASWRDSFTPAVLPFPGDSFVKRGSLLIWIEHEEIPPTPGEELASEAEILEIIRSNPHPNVCEYRGAVREGDFIVGLCMKRYSRTLFEFMESPDALVVDKSSLFAAIVDGVKHIHSLGLVHNDLTPYNIMLDDSNIPVIIDFGCCLPEGQPCSLAGTFGWAKPWGMDVSEKATDEYSLSLIERFLHGTYDMDEVITQRNPNSKD